MLEDRYGRRSTIITSQIPVGRHPRFASSTTPTASISLATACAVPAPAKPPRSDRGARSSFHLLIVNCMSDRITARRLRSALPPAAAGLAHWPADARAVVLAPVIAEIRASGITSPTPSRRPSRHVEFQQQGDTVSGGPHQCGNYSIGSISSSSWRSRRCRSVVPRRRVGCWKLATESRKRYKAR